MVTPCLKNLVRLRSAVSCVSFSIKPHLRGKSLLQVNGHQVSTSHAWSRSLASTAADSALLDHVSDDIDRLRKKHREEAMSEHSSEDGPSFGDLPINAALAQQLVRLGYQKPFEIQTKTLEHTLKGSDVIGRAVTGSGKTLAFSIPIVQKLSGRVQDRMNSRCSTPRAIVLAPTRELCNQIYKSIQELQPSLRCVALYGGDSIIRQMRELQRGVDVACATPGRLNDHINRGNLALDRVEFLCLDEADELLTPNFKDQIEDVLTMSPKNKQMLLFSATMPPDVRQIANRYMKDPVYVDLAQSQQQMAPLSVEHLCVEVPSHQHNEILQSVIRSINPERCIVFLKTKINSDRTANELRRQGVKAEALHSDLSQSRREFILNSFRVGKTRILCATDVAARGLDIPEVDLVIQVGPPANGIDYYIHRTGRTGRAGRKGQAVLIHSGSFEDRSALKQISRLVRLKHVSPSEVFNVTPSARSEHSHSGWEDEAWRPRERQFSTAGSWEQPWEQRVQSAAAQLIEVSESDLQKTMEDARLLVQKSPESAMNSVAAALYLLANRSSPRQGSFNRPRMQNFSSNNFHQRNRRRHTLYDDDED